jgi:microcystin-dependent protein
MSSPFVAEIRIFPFNFAPTGWAFCDGQVLPLSQNTALFSLLGTTYGGDGKSNFALPNLQGSVPMFYGQGPGLSLHDIGESGGETTVTLLESEVPSHGHSLQASTHNANLESPGPSVALGRSSPSLIYKQPAGAAPAQPLSDQAIAPAGGDQPHNNMMPYLTLNFCIALQGVFPPRT